VLAALEAGAGAEMVEDATAGGLGTVLAEELAGVLEDVLEDVLADVLAGVLAMAG
jgi:hypothetical protein